ncbi:MAG: T9SS type A sorting domain-containing protein [Ignavibacteriales bacterium]|nr:T9SS type A sorting domain-containing protein [Ignavibacteriales bacterium]
MTYLKPVWFVIFIFYYQIDAQNNTTSPFDSTIKIIIVAGQSNAMNWHADANLLDTNIIDKNILYYYHTGLPPSKGDSVPFNSTSDSQWTTLKYQTQNPYIKCFHNFFGPEITLSRELYSSIQNLAVIKCAYGGSNLAVDWRKGIGTGNQLYELMICEIDTATSILSNQGFDYEFIGFFWMQGESDAANSDYANNYETNLTNFINNLRSDLDCSNLKFILGRIGIDLPSPYIYKDIVRTAQMNVADLDSLVEWVNIDDLPLDIDFVHLLADGEIELGTRMADAFLNATGISNEKDFIENKITLNNFPNPFNNTTNIYFTITENSFVTLKIFDIIGREIKLLIQEYINAGTYSITFNAEKLSSGIYFIQLKTDIEETKTKIILLK